MKCTELVINDHSILRRGLDILQGMVQKLENGERIEIADVTAVLNFLRDFGDEYHQFMEEKVLFPALLRAIPQDRALHHMLFEHDEERALVAGIEDALRYKSGRNFVETSRQLLVLLRDHLNKEDALLRDMAEGLLSAEQDDIVAAEFAKNRRQPEMYADFSRLECKYMGKPQVSPVTPADGYARAHRSA